MPGDKKMRIELMTLEKTPLFLNDSIQDDKGVTSSANIKGDKAIKSPNAKYN